MGAPIPADADGRVLFEGSAKTRSRAGSYARWTAPPATEASGGLGSADVEGRPRDLGYL
jgi:hypothetical protein